MAATALYHLSAPPSSSPHKFPLLPSIRFSTLSFSNPNISSPSHPITTFTTRSVSSPQTPVVEQEQEPDSPLSLSGCKACGREEIENGCNGEGRIQGGIATVPGFGWWPIKAYRPCPAFVASGGRYRRTGQSMDEVVSGKGVRDTSNGRSAGAQSSKKKRKDPGNSGGDI